MPHFRRPDDQPVMPDCQPLACRNTALTPANHQATSGAVTGTGAGHGPAAEACAPVRSSAAPGGQQTERNPVDDFGSAAHPAGRAGLSTATVSIDAGKDQVMRLCLPRRPPVQRAELPGE
ncbi:hypothetical protein GCM10010321_88400 [Streptomyces chartreusis]|nr:hypothetical protein GCM10010321_88400 [Streptomyces chartreusis]